METLIELIDTAQAMLNAGFDLDTFLHWRHLAFLCLLGLVGPLHFYTRRFRQLKNEPSPQNLLAAAGILEAARQQVANPVVARQQDGKQMPAAGDSKYIPWAVRKKRRYHLKLLGSDLQE